MLVTTKIDLDVISKYNEIVGASLGENSFYIRAKETLDELFQDASIDKNMKGQIISKFLEQNTALAASAMNTALEWTAKMKELELAKEELSYKLDFISAQVDSEKAKRLAVDVGRNLEEANIIRNFGIPVYVDGKITSLSDSGKLYTEQLNTAKETENKTKEGVLLDSQNKDTQAKTHKIIAETLVNFGIYDGYSISQSGITDVSKNSSNETLSDTQQKVAEQTALGYRWNAYANAATSAASMIGVQISSGNVTGLTSADIERWRTSVDKLNSIPSVIV
jgi:hypothetical protein